MISVDGGGARRFAGKVALVTGAASGIGRATVERLAVEGAALAIADVQRAGLQETAERVRRAEVEVLPIVCDVSNPSAVASAVGETMERFGGLDVLCNIAGILRFENTHEESIEEWNRILAVNLTGTFLFCRCAIPHLIERRGAIVNMSSTAALAGHAWAAAYSASKGGVLALTRALAVEYGKQGLRANAVCPGAIDTPIQNAFRVPRGADGKLVERILPFTGFGAPATVAGAIAFLASDDASHINGSELRVDGGMLA